MEENRNNHSNIDIVTGDYKVAIRKLAWPMMVSMLLIMAYNIADSIWVAGLGADALAAIGFITPIFMILIGLGNGIGAGANSMIARFIGAQNKDEADNTALHSLLLTVIISILGAVVMFIILPTALDIMGAGTAKQDALNYGYIVFTFMIVFIYNGVGTAILRSEGDVNRAMYAMAVTAIFNIVLDPIFIYVLDMGMNGAAWATVLSAFLSCFVLIYWMHIKKDTYLDLSFKKFKYENSIIWGILNVAIPSTAENLVFSILGIVINYMLVMVSGTIAVATYTAGMRLIQLSMIPLMGLGTAMLTVSGAAFGAKNYKKLQDAYFYSIKVGLAISAIMAIVFYIIAPQLSMVFAYSSSASLQPLIADFLRIMVFFIFSVCLGMLSAMVFQGVGKGFTSLLLTALRALILELVFAYLFGIIFNLGVTGIYYGVLIGGLLGGIISFAWGTLFVTRLRKNYEKLEAN